MSDKISKSVWEFFNHNVTIGALVISVVFWVNAGDKPNNDAIIKLQTRQKIITLQLEKIENNHLAYIQAVLNELLVQVSKLTANQEQLLDKLN